MKPLIGIGILNYRGAEMTIECLDHVFRLDWPADRLHVVVVDNGSGDSSVDRMRQAHPEVTYIESPVNRGFAGGSNLALEACRDADYVALLNNDTLVDPGWLQPLVETLESDPGTGAASPKILFAATYIDLICRSPAQRPPGEHRDLGVRISGLRVDGEDRFSRCHLAEGFWSDEPSGWTNGHATLRVPMSCKERGAECAIRVSGLSTGPLTISTGDECFEFEVCTQPSWITLPLRGVPFDLVNNAGSELVLGRNAADRGIFQPDRGQFDEGDEVFAWCGCSVLLSPSYLDDVGLFDETLFLYYEDFDLSWRGRRRGWRYRYVPESVVRHLHASTSGEYSDTFNFYVWRNRLLVLLKNAPLRAAYGEAAGFGSHVARSLRRDLAARRISPESRKLLRALGSFLRHAPAACGKRAAIGLRNRSKPREDLDRRTGER